MFFDIFTFYDVSTPFLLYFGTFVQAVFLWCLFLCRADVYSVHTGGHVKGQGQIRGHGGGQGRGQGRGQHTISASDIVHPHTEEDVYDVIDDKAVSMVTIL